MPKLPITLPNEPDALEDAVQKQEQAFAPIKENDEAKIIWANEDTKEKTSYSIVYLHGFAGSHGDGYPWHKTIAQKFCCNLYLARLDNHGLKRKNLFEGFTVDKFLYSAIDACRIGQMLGENVLVMGTSAGASLALFAAGSDKCPVSVKGLMLVSPLIHFYGVHSLFLENPFGRFMAKAIRGSSYRHRLIKELSPHEKNIWYPFVPLNAACILGKMVETYIDHSLFSRVRCPVFVGYYYKNRNYHDRVVSPRAILQMCRQLGTEASKRSIVNFPEAQSHVIGSGVVSTSVQELIAQTQLFLEEKVGLTKAKS